MSNSPRPHDDAVVELLREDPALVDEYLAAALEDADKEGGRQALGGVTPCCRSAGHGGRCRALLAVLDAAGLKLGVHRALPA